MTEKNFYYLVGIALIILLVLVVYLSGRVSQLEAAVFGEGALGGEGLGASTYDAYYGSDPYYTYDYNYYPSYTDYSATLYDSYYGDDYYGDPYDYYGSQYSY